MDFQGKPVIEVSHLTKDYGYGRGVFDVSISVHQGECYGYLGPNGAGKSTTIRHIMSSCLFNRTRKSLALGGGFAVWCFLAMVIGLFGTKTFVSLGLGVEAMRVFNYMTLLTLFDTESVDTFCKFWVGTSEVSSYTWIIEYAVLAVIAAVTTIVGMHKFEKKDLPL